MIPVAKYFWDLNPTALRETQRALQNPADPRFLDRTVALLSRCDSPKEFFSILPKKKFTEAWPRIRSYWIKRARESVQRDWWDTLYEQLVETPAAKPQEPSSTLFRNLGHALRKRRIELGLSQKQIAHQTGLSQPTVSQIEEGKKNITLLTLFRVCKVLKMNSLEVC